MIAVELSAGAIFAICMFAGVVVSVIALVCISVIYSKKK